jgi:hypothetical protein
VEDLGSGIHSCVGGGDFVRVMVVTNNYVGIVVEVNQHNCGCRKFHGGFLSKHANNNSDK